MELKNMSTNLKKMATEINYNQNLESYNYFLIFFFSIILKKHKKKINLRWKEI